MSQPDRSPVDIPAVIRQIAAQDIRRRAISNMMLGLGLALLSCWFSISRVRPDFSWSPVEVVLVTPLVALCGLLVAQSVRTYLRHRA